MEEKEKNNSEYPIVQYIISGKQVNVCTGDGTINALQNNVPETITKQIIIKNEVTNNYEQKVSGQNDESGNGLLLLYGIALIAALGFYMQHRWQILIGFVVTSLLIELCTSMIYFRGKKNGILYDINLKQIGVFNIISVLLVPVMIGIIASPLYNNRFGFDTFEQQISTQGVMQAFFTNTSGKYAIFQMVGLLWVGLFLCYILISDIYIIAVINVAMERKGQKFWIWLIGMTCGKSKVGKEHIKKGIIYMAIGIIMTVGILPYILELIQKNSQIPGL